MQKTRQQLGCLSPRKRPKTMQNELRSSFLAPFRADRATAASDIVQHVAADDLRHLTEAAAHGMPVYVWSAFLAATRLVRISRRCRILRSQIVGGHMVNDVRRCGGSIGSKRRQKRRSQLILHGFWPFSQREAAHLLPRFLQRVVRLPAPTT